MKLVFVEGGLSHLIEPRTVDGLACNAGHNGRKHSPRRVVEVDAGRLPGCERCRGMLRQGTHPNLPISRSA